MESWGAGGVEGVGRLAEAWDRPILKRIRTDEADEGDWAAADMVEMVVEGRS